MAELSASTTNGETGILQRLKKHLPGPVFAYLLSDDLEALHRELFAKHKVDADAAAGIYALELEVFAGDVPLNDFPDRVWSVLPWEADREDDAVALVNDLVGKVFLPAQDALGDVAGLLSDLGADVAAYAGPKIGKRTLSYDAGATEIIDRAGTIPTELNSRARVAIVARLRGVRDDLETKDALMKSRKTGGLEMTESEAQGIVDLIKDALMVTTYQALPSEDEQAQSAPAASGAPADAPAPRTFTAEQIKALYVGTAEEREALAARIKKFREVTKDDAAAARDAFFQVIYPPDGKPADPLYVVGGLLSLAEIEQLTKLLTEDERFEDIVSGNIVGNRAVDDPETTQILAEFQEAPDDPAYMNVLLQLLLRGFAGYETSESARYGLMITNTLKRHGGRRYDGLAAFDSRTGKFAWTVPVALE